jgi:hypothetical protein
VDVAAIIYDSIRNSPTSQHPHRDRHSSNRLIDPLIAPPGETGNNLYYFALSASIRVVLSMTQSEK